MALLQQASVVNSIITAVRYVGLWHIEKRYNKHVLALFAIFCYFSIYVFQLIELILSKDDLKRFFECFSVINFCGMGILKLFILSHKRELWFSILDKMRNIEFSQMKSEDLSIAEYKSVDEEEDEHVAEVTRSYTKNYKVTSAILYKIYYFICFIFILTPFVEYFFMLLKGDNQEKFPHILPSWNPFDNVHIICYVISVICEAVAAIYCLSVHITFDVTFIGVAIFACGHFKLLVFQSERIGGSGKICGLSKRRDTRAHYRIMKYHRIHNQLVSLIDELNRLLIYILGFYFFLTTFTLGAVAVRVKSEQHSVMQLVSLLQYMFGILIQLYIYCSYGDAVYNESAINVGQGPFGAAIWCLSPKIRREIILLGVGMMKPRRLYAGPFNTVDLPSFIKIVRAAYSYYALLCNRR